MVTVYLEALRKRLNKHMVYAKGRRCPPSTQSHIVRCYANNNDREVYLGIDCIIHLSVPVIDLHTPPVTETR